ncbi:MAG: ATP-binding protein [Clostridia bacterium]|nr:ATP-binding protein [Clostridia bacterium]
MSAKRNMLITGPPGSGKTTVIYRLLELLPLGAVAGFYTDLSKGRGALGGYHLQGLMGELPRCLPS